MKRSGPLARRTPLARTAMKPARHRIKPRSTAAVEDIERRATVKANVLRRDGSRCVIASWAGTTIHAAGIPPIYVPTCGGPLDFGHRRHASAGGAYVEANGNAVCRIHNGWAEDQPDAARAVGGECPWWLVVREGDPEWELLGRKAQGAR